MTRVVRNAALLCVGGILVASAALANVPDPAHSTLSNFVAGNYHIIVEGKTTGGTPDPCTDGRCGDYAVTVRDAANNPIAGSTVLLDFSACSDNTPANRDFVLACTQASDETFSAGPKVQGTTNASGQFSFRVIGAANGATTATNTTSPGNPVANACAALYADGVLLGNIIPSAFDITLNNGSNSGDASLALAEANKVALGAVARSRTDVNFSGTVTSADASLELSEANQTGLGTGSAVTGPYCP